MLVDSPPEPNAETAPAPPKRRAIRAAGLLVSVAVLVLIALASIAIGAKDLSLSQVWHGLFDDSGTYGDVVVSERLSRTVLGLLVGAGLGLAGAVLQRSPAIRWPTPDCSASTRARPRRSSRPSPTSASPR